MKFTIESFDFSGLSENSILMIEVDENKTNALQRVNRTIEAIFKAKKIPDKALCLINSKQHPINLREIPEKVMNDNGWFKLKVQFENAHPLSSESVASHNPSNHSHQK